jgi:inositol oxygenase
MSERDQATFKWVRQFQPCDLYSKSKERPDPQELRPYSEQLIAEYFPPQIAR